MRASSSSATSILLLDVMVERCFKHCESLLTTWLEPVAEICVETGLVLDSR